MKYDDHPPPIRLSDALRAEARALDGREPRPAQATATLDAMHARFAQRKPAPGHRWWRWALAGPALCGGALLAGLWLITLAPAGETGAVVARGSDFIVLVSAERWAAFQTEGAKTAWLVPTDVPRERLALLGLPYDPSDAAGTVHAELLVQASGDVLAMRVLP